MMFWTTAAWPVPVSVAVTGQVPGVYGVAGWLYPARTLESYADGPACWSTVSEVGLRAPQEGPVSDRLTVSLRGDVAVVL